MRLSRDYRPFLFAAGSLVKWLLRAGGIAGTNPHRFTASLLQDLLWCTGSWVFAREHQTTCLHCAFPRRNLFRLLDVISFNVAQLLLSTKQHLKQPTWSSAAGQLSS